MPADGLRAAGRPYVSWHFENEHGQRVRGFHVTPDDSDGPFPVLHEVYVFEAGHGSFDVDERVRQVSTILAFLARHVPGLEPPASE